MDTESWWRFLEMCASVRDPERMDELLGFFLTPAEQEAVALRFALISILLEGEMSQREVAKALGISIAKITRGSNALKEASDKLKRLIQRH